MRHVFLHNIPTQIILTPEDLKEGFIIHFDITKFDGSTQITVSSDDAQLSDALKHRTRRHIPGHPNCHLGDCGYDCQVASCGIHQGYEKVPPYHECILDDEE